MPLTGTQISAFAADLQSNTDQAVVDALADGNNNALLAWYNAEASPEYYLWRTSMPVQEMRDEHFDWAEIVGSLTTNGLLSLQVLTDQQSVNPAKPSIRAAFAQIFSGPQLENTRTALLAAAKRLATNAQKFFADTTSGDGTENLPATAVVESIMRDDVRAAVAIINAE